MSSLTFSNRITSCIVISPAGRALYNFQSKLELLKALRDAIKAHKSLYIRGEIPHRDISERNIIMTDLEAITDQIGMLIDFDLGQELDSGRSGL